MPESARRLDGKAISAAVRADVKRDVAAWTAQGHRPPYLAVGLVGDDPASASYVRGKARACEEVGIESDTLTYDADMSEADLLALIDKLNTDDAVDGILVQLPLPRHMDEGKAACQM